LNQRLPAPVIALGVGTGEVNFAIVEYIPL